MGDEFLDWMRHTGEVIPLDMFCFSIGKKKFCSQIEDETLVPREFLKVDDKAIKTAIRNGVRNIPGIKITQEDK